MLSDRGVRVSGLGSGSRVSWLPKPGCRKDFPVAAHGRPDFRTRGFQVA